MVAKMPLLISSRITSAGLTPSSSASSLTVMVAGSSTAPRSFGSATWTATWAKAPSRRCGLRGPRRPRVPLLLRAIERPPAHDAPQLVGEDRRNRCRQCVAEPAARERAGDARLVVTDVGAAAIGLAGRVIGDRPIGRADDPQQVALVAAFAAADAGSGRDRSTPERDRPGAYDPTSLAAALARRARGFVAPSLEAPFELPSGPGPTATATFSFSESAVTAVLRARVVFAGALSAAASCSATGSASAFADALTL